MAFPIDDEDFEAQHDLRTLKEARQLKGDPDRVARARDFAKRQAEEFERLAGDDGESDLEQGFTRLGKLGD